MALRFRYEFGGRPSYYTRNGEQYDDGMIDTEEYIYEPDWEEARDYIIRTHSLDDILKDYIDSGFYNNLDAEDKETLLSYDGFDGTEASIDKMSEDIKLELVTELIFELLDDTDIYEDELMDYFEQDAFDEWEDSIS